jgi:CRP-like cAMP-binding protein
MIAGPRGGSMATHNQYHEYLRKVPLFADLDADELDIVGQAATDLDLPAGSVLMREGAVAHELVVVVTGTLEVTRDGEHVADIGSGGFAGELAVLTRQTRTSTVIASTDVSLLHIDGRVFATLLEDVPQLAVKMLKVVAARAIDNS